MCRHQRSARSRCTAADAGVTRQDKTGVMDAHAHGLARFRRSHASEASREIGHLS
ncbi:hypothetical protein SAMN05446589_8871 [Streptomyces sp. OV198]|nr:hypothetical protein SAMN05446589_8871 [Streptomyces sp. OV198]